MYFVARPPAMAAPIVAPPSTFEQGSLTISSRDPSWGNRTAPVTLIDFGDLQCPFCRRAAATLIEVRARYGARVRIVWKNNPLAFHTRTESAAEVAMEAFHAQGDAVFWQMHDLLYENQARRAAASARPRPRPVPVPLPATRQEGVSCACQMLASPRW